MGPGRVGDGRAVRPIALPAWCRGIRGAVVVGAALRLAWVIVATRTSPSAFSDPSEFLSMALDFGHLDLPRFHDGPFTALFPPGYSLLLAPFVTVADAVGLASPAFVASLVNVAAAAVTIWLTGHVAAQWFDARVGRLAAWVIAFAPAQIYFTSTAHSETVFTACTMGAVAVATRWRGTPPSRSVPLRWQVALGALIGFTGLVRSPGLVLLAVPVVVGRTSGWSWRGVARAMAGVAVGVVLVLAPWTIRNGIQVGHWSPLSTGNATALCLGHHPGFMEEDYDPVWFQLNDDAAMDCLARSPFDDARLGMIPPDVVPNGPDEPRWYREATRFAVRSALANLDREVVWTARKLQVVLFSEAGAVEGARNWAEPDWAGPVETPLMVLAHLWLWGVEALAVLAVVRRRGRAGVGLMATGALVFLLVPVAAIAYPHQHHPAMPFLAVLAAAALSTMRRRAAGGQPAEEAITAPV